jgi:NAD(P)-dependent dehydrogenase (short-subunit alcohol dehydrogenase family)
VTQWPAARAIAAPVEADLGGTDILVNNAGVSRMTRFLDLDEAEWDRVMNINLKGVFLTCRAVLPGMVERKRGGHVINIRSVLSKLGEPNFSHYAASKFGVLGLTQSIAQEMAQYDITANTVRPGESCIRHSGTGFSSKPLRSRPTEPRVFPTPTCRINCPARRPGPRRGRYQCRMRRAGRRAAFLTRLRGRPPECLQSYAAGSCSRRSQV